MQAFVITAYKDKKQLLRLIDKVSTMGKVYIHIDKKSNELDLEDIKKTISSNVTVESKYKIYWGAYNHICAILDLVKMAVSDEDIHYVHIISGQDYPVKSKEEFERKFDRNYKSIHMSCSDKSIYDSGVVERYGYWYPITNNDPNALITRLFNRLAVSCQKIINKKRTGIGTLSEIYKGMIYASAPKDAFKYALDYIEKNKKFIKDIKHTRIAEEFLFQTIFMNSKYKENVNSNGLRYNDWKNGDGKSPAYLTVNNYEDMKNGEYFFARKFASGISDELLDKFI